MPSKHNVMRQARRDGQARIIDFVVVRRDFRSGANGHVRPNPNELWALGYQIVWRVCTEGSRTPKCACRLQPQVTRSVPEDPHQQRNNRDVMPPAASAPSPASLAPKPPARSPSHPKKPATSPTDRHAVAPNASARGLPSGTPVSAGDDVAGMRPHCLADACRTAGVCACVCLGTAG